MSYFLAISMRSQRRPPMRASYQDYFLSAAKLTLANSIPIGAALRNGQDAPVFLVTVNGCSTDLLGRGSPQHDRSDSFLKCLRELVDDEGRVSVLLHWFSGDVRTELVPIDSKSVVSMADFRADYPRISCNVRYAIVSEKTTLRRDHL